MYMYCILLRLTEQLQSAYHTLYMYIVVLRLDTMDHSTVALKVMLGTILPS